MSAAHVSSTRVHLFSLHPSVGSRHTQKRLGRGRSSGLGKTSGHGHKGQKARSGNGKPKAGFEGGQTTISKLFPKKGFTNSINGKTYAPVNLDRIAHWIEQGRLTSSPEKPITAKELVLSGCIHNAHDGVKLLGDGAEHLKVPIHITPSRASKSAISAVEKLGGTVYCRYYNRLSLYDCVKGHTDHVDAAPTRRQDIPQEPVTGVSSHQSVATRRTSSEIEDNVPISPGFAMELLMLDAPENGGSLLKPWPQTRDSADTTNLSSGFSSRSTSVR